MKKKKKKKKMKMKMTLSFGYSVDSVLRMHVMTWRFVLFFETIPFRQNRVETLQIVAMPSWMMQTSVIFSFSFFFCFVFLICFCFCFCFRLGQVPIFKNRHFTIENKPPQFTQRHATTIVFGWTRTCQCRGHTLAMG